VITDLHCKQITVDVIALQETWEIRYADQLLIPGFQQTVFKNREGTRGGGVGFHVRNGLTFKILENLSPFETKIFESLTIQLTYPSKKIVLLTCGYRSNGLIVNVTPAQQMERFMLKYDELLGNLARKKLDCYIFMDSNIDLLNLQEATPANFLNTTLSSGFLQCIRKATRFQNNCRSLIDHILTSCRQNTFVSRTILSDVSDHFFTFICTTSKTEKNRETTKTFRSFTLDNLNRFKLLLGGTDWNNVLNHVDVEEAYDAFWAQYTLNFELCFPLRKIRFNRNVHKKNPFMSQGLLNSREIKNKMHLKTYSKTPSYTVHTVNRQLSAIERVLKMQNAIRLEIKLGM